MDFSNAYAIAVKDMKEVFSSVEIWGPMLGVPLFFSLMLPLLTFYVTRYAAPNIANKVLASTVTASGATGFNAVFMTFFSINVLGPIFLTMPILTAAVIAADSFAGEKERKTSEALLATPISSAELLVGKIMASFVPATLLTVGVFALYGFVTNWLAMQQFGVSILPTLPWLMMLATSPFLAIVTIGVVVWVSSHVKGTKEAQQISTLLVLPVLVIPFISILGIVDLTSMFFAYLMLVLAAADVAIIYLGIKSFRKTAIR